MLTFIFNLNLLIKYKIFSTVMSGLKLASKSCKHEVDSFCYVCGEFFQNKIAMDESQLINSKDVKDFVRHMNLPKSKAEIRV